MKAESQPVGITRTILKLQNIQRCMFFVHSKHYKTLFILSILSVRAELQKPARCADLGANFLGLVLIILGSMQILITER